MIKKTGYLTMEIEDIFSEVAAVRFPVTALEAYLHTIDTYIKRRLAERFQTIAIRDRNCLATDGDLSQKQTFRLRIEQFGS